MFYIILFIIIFVGLSENDIIKNLFLIIAPPFGLIQLHEIWAYILAVLVSIVFICINIFVLFKYLLNSDNHNVTDKFYYYIPKIAIIIGIIISFFKIIEIPHSNTDKLSREDLINNNYEECFLYNPNYENCTKTITKSIYLDNSLISVKL